MKIITCILLAGLISSNLFAVNHIKESIVKIYTVSKIPNYNTPWNSSIKRSNGSGSIIKGNRILTNAHVVANQTFIEVKRHGDTKRYVAYVEFISHQADLALLTLKEQTFFEDTKSLEFGGLPDIQQEVTVYGFPIGGQSLSVSTGIVSRIEHSRYVHSRERFLSIQIDAAVNPGSSGGPAISDDKIVGVVMQQMPSSQNIGYLVPVEIIKHFLNDIEDGIYDGFPYLGIGTAKMENKTLRSVYKMGKDNSGLLIYDISEKSSAFKKLKPEDVILTIDGHRIENDGSVEFRHHQSTSYKYYIDKKQLGDTIKMEIFRDGKIVPIEMLLGNVADDDLLVNTVEYDVMPKYFIYGGYVFTPLSRNLLMGKKSTLLQLREAAGEWTKNEKEEVVVLLKVLASKTNRGNHNFSLWVIDKVNSKPFKNFKEFTKILKSFSGQHLLLENKSGLKIAIDQKEAIKTQKCILERYSIDNNERL